MAEAWPEEDEESMRRDNREQVVRRQSNGTEGRPGRRKPENRLSQGPLWSLRAAIKRSTTRSNIPDPQRERNRNADARIPVARRPEITILSAEPLPSSSWLAVTPGAFPPPPPPPTQIWGPTIPPSIQPPPSYDEVIREKTQELVARTSSSPPSSMPSSHPAFCTTIATQTDTGAPGKQVKLPRPPIPAAPSQTDAEIGTPLTPPCQNGQSAQLSGATPVAKKAELPRPRPRSRFTATAVSDEVKVQTLVKLREDGLATLAARARCDIGKQDASQGKYLQELLEAFSSDDWGLPEQRGDDSGLSQSEDDDDNDNDDDDDMAALKARIQAFEQQQAAPDGSCDNSGVNEEAVAEKPEPRPRPRLRGQSVKVLPPAIAPKPKTLHKAATVDSAQPPPEVVNPEPPPITEHLPTHASSTPPCTAPVPAPRFPPLKPSPSAIETPSTTKSPARPPIAPRTSVGAAPHEKAHVAPTRPPRPLAEISRGMQMQTPDTASLTGSSLEPNPVPSKLPVPSPAPVHAKPSSPGLKKAESICEPPLPPRPSSVKTLPPRPPSIKSIPARPPLPAIIPSSESQPQPPSSFTASNHRASKKGPPLPPRPKPGHPLYPVCTEDLIVLEDLPPEPPPTLVTPLCNTSACLMDLEVLPPVQLPEPALQTLWKPATQQRHEPPPVSGPRYVALFDFEGAVDDELTFSQGDVIALLEIVDQQWGRGQLHGRVGLFPLSFTRVTEGHPPQSPVTKIPPKETEVEEWAVALFDFPGQTAEDLCFHKGAYIQVTEHVDADWRRGRLDGREGLYPAAFTQPCKARPIPSQKVAVRGVAKALFPFKAEHEDELTVKPGDIITQVESADKQWIMGVVDSKRGIVPKNYVLLL
ncbi:SH3 domain-containing protein 19-like isoform X2 [Hippocampus zosterae]|uniref:SH3 domain-containing protein 19-like isoform X2 n=1 Tax=Hippocampus zosterae TaxID=109293 RepID=UPI00223D21B0|nr:SH3 domain-containing protein 19-like isoform X2 [Hippocampus zosterae]